MTINQRQIYFDPGTKEKIKVFIQSTRDQMRIGLYLSVLTHPVVDTPYFIKVY